jgi:hypothetical protein
MRARLLLLGILFGLVSGVSSAHGTKVHVRGTIEKVNADSVQIKTPDGKSVEVKLTSSTIFLLHVVAKQVKPSDTSTDKPAKAADLSVGDLVVIHATSKRGALEADEVKFSVPSANRPAPGATPKPKP